MTSHSSFVYRLLWLMSFTLLAVFVLDSACTGPRRDLGRLHDAGIALTERAQTDATAQVDAPKKDDTNANDTRTQDIYEVQPDQHQSTEHSHGTEHNHGSEGSSNNCNENECMITPSPLCLDASKLRTYEGKGSCHPTQDKCVYKYTDKTCPGSCKEGRCLDKSDACANTKCDKPSTPRCINSMTVRHYRAPGTCKDKLCRYPHTDKKCTYGCQKGKCLPDPCAGIRCQKPPASKCLNSTTLRNYYNPGSCKSKRCSYPYADQRCPHGCASNKCKIGAGFTALNPYRSLDTRGGSPVSAQKSKCVQVAGKGGVPSSVRAVYLNLVAVDPKGLGFLTAYARGAKVPLTSTLNYKANETIANGTIVRVGSGGQICVFTSVTTDLIVDVVGYFGPTSDYFPVGPFRRIDTRKSSILKDKSTQCYQVAGRNGIPSTAKAAFVNLVAVEPKGVGFLTAYAEGAKLPLASSLNYPAKQTIANGALVKFGRGGKICVYTHASAHLIIDVVGYFGSSSSLFPIQLLRQVDTRGGSMLGAGKRRCHTVAGLNGIPSTARTVAINIVAVGPNAPGFLHVYPDGQAQQTISTLNYPKGVTRANNALVQVGSNGKICVYTTSTTHYVLDINGYWEKAKPGNPCSGVVCKSPPPTTCVGGKSIVSYASTGTCNNGTCIYKVSTKTCSWKCTGTKCIPKPPPPPVKTTYHPVTSWQRSSQPVSSGSLMSLLALRYITIHYNGGNLDLDGRDNIYQDSDFAQILRNIQNDYVRNRGYSIGYNSAVAPDGDEWELRGLRFRAAANGCGLVNKPAYTIFVPVRSVSASPTLAQVQGVKNVIARIRAAARAAGNKNTLVVNGHRDVRPRCPGGGGTACPGQPLYNLIKNGTLR